MLLFYLLNFYRFCLVVEIFEFGGGKKVIYIKFFYLKEFLFFYLFEFLVGWVCFLWG